MNTLWLQKTSLIPVFRKFFSLPRYSFLILVLCPTILHDHPLCAGITKTFNLQLGSKSIYLFGDHHKAGKEGDRDKQVDHFLESVQETANQRNTPLEVLVEKGQSKENYRRMLYDLESEVVTKKLTNIKIEDAEIRKTSISVHEILNSPYPFELREHYTIFDDGPLLFSLTFNDIIESYNFWLAYAQEFRAHYTLTNKGLDQKQFISFDTNLFQAQVWYSSFEKLMRQRNITANTNIGQYALEYYRAHKTTDHELTYANDEMFCFLFNTYLFIRVYTCQSNQVAIVAGGDHIDHVHYMLRDLGATKKIEWNSNDTKPNYSDIRLLSKYELKGTLKGAFLTHSLYNFFLMTSIYVTIYFGRFLSFISPDKGQPPTIVSH